MAKSKNGLRRNDIPASRTEVDVDFVLERNGAEHVYVCGDFNHWQPLCLRLIGNPDSGLWEKRVTLPPGRYEYKFVVDGNWIHDPDAQENAPNPYGSLNSVLEVGPLKNGRTPQAKH